MHHDLPRIVADALSCGDENGSLSPKDIEIKFEAQGPHDVDNYDVEILVTAMDFPSRKANIQERAALIADKLLPRIPRLDEKYQICVFVTLSPAGFAEQTRTIRES
ncbi:MAG: hypothetical protein NTW79_01120 [Candidatus Berkelbacteria bacterium]|nr:hypothetical protein [Candidatus Berkelbacteria bacterium]